jgi:hypothetical protein
MPKHDSSSETLDHLRVAHRLPEPDRSKTLRPKSPLTDKCLVSCLAGANSAPGRGLNAWADPQVRLLCGQRQVEEPLAASETGYTCPGRGLNARAEPEVRLLCGKCGCAKPLAQRAGGHRHGCASSAMAADPNTRLSWLGAILFTLPLPLKESVSRSARSRLVLFIVSDRRRIRYLGSFVLG